MSPVTIVLSLALLGVVNSQGLIPGVSNQCFEPVSRGPCRAFIPQFFFNHQTGMCDCFVFGGCQGNSNKFARLDQCMSTCNVNPARQAISQDCIRIFGSGNSNFVQSPRPITQAPIVNPQPIITSFPAVPAKAIQQGVNPATAAPTTAAPATAAPATSAPVRAPAPVVTSSPAIIQQGSLISSQTSQGFANTGIIGSIFTQNGVTGQTTIKLGQPIFISRRTGKNRKSKEEEDDDK